MIQAICLWLLNIFGWKINGQLPNSKQYIMIVGPHTSNWDFVLGVVARGALAIKVNFLAKHQLFHPLWGWFFKALGGHPVDRRKNNNLVDAVADIFQQHPDFKLALAPEGTRSAVRRWKTGFYHIAVKAQVPIIAVGFDFGRRQVVIRQPLQATGDITQEMNQLLDFFRSVEGRFPKVIPQYSQD